MILPSKLIPMFLVLVSFLNRSAQTVLVNEEDLTADLEFTENDDIITILKRHFKYKIPNYSRVSVKVYHAKPRKAEDEQTASVTSDKPNVDGEREFVSTTRNSSHLEATESYLQRQNKTEESTNFTDLACNNTHSIVTESSYPKDHNETEESTNTDNMKSLLRCHSEVVTKPPNPKRQYKTEQSLKLTPFINENKIDEARNASRVDPCLFLCVESYSGYFTVNETYDSNIFFWYFPVEKKPLNDTPLIIWLQGGPGVSSMQGLFSEIGPFTFINSKNLAKNPNTWLRNHSLLFIDNPVGTGFSYTKDENGYATDMQTYADHLYSTVSQFMRVFPELRYAPLYIAGESYAGKYVPALASHIHHHLTDFWGPMRLQGIMVGNAFIDPEMLLKITEMHYCLGLLDYQQKKRMQPLMDEFQDDIKSHRSVAAEKKWSFIMSNLTSLTRQKNKYNFLDDNSGFGKYTLALQKRRYKTALHVGDDIYYVVQNHTVYDKLSPDFLNSAKGLYEDLLNEGYRVLTYCGHLDMMVPCVAMTEQSHSWRWSWLGSGYEDFHNATRYPYMYDGKLAGYHKTGGGLTEVVFRGAGHMVPAERPEPIAELVARWTQQKPLDQEIIPRPEDRNPSTSKPT